MVRFCVGEQLAREVFVVAAHVRPEIEGAVGLDHVEHRRQDGKDARVFLAVQRAIRGGMASSFQAAMLASCVGTGMAQP